jgi:hypothetical protein
MLNGIGAISRAKGLYDVEAYTQMMNPMPQTPPIISSTEMSLIAFNMTKPLCFARAGNHITAL